jgi:hypothetical protein
VQPVTWLARNLPISESTPRRPWRRLSGVVSCVAFSFAESPDQQQTKTHQVGQATAPRPSLAKLVRPSSIAPPCHIRY